MEQCVQCGAAQLLSSCKDTTVLSSVADLIFTYLHMVHNMLLLLMTVTALMVGVVSEHIETKQ